MKNEREGRQRFFSLHLFIVLVKAAGEAVQQGSYTAATNKR